MCTWINKAKNRKAFTIVELVIVIAVIAILATVLVPTFGNVISNAKDSAAKQEARNAYTEYVVEAAASGSMGQYYVYQADEGRFVAINSGSAVGVYATKEAALAAMVNNPTEALVPTGNGKLFAYGAEPALGGNNGGGDTTPPAETTRTEVLRFSEPTAIKDRYVKVVNGSKTEGTTTNGRAYYFTYTAANLTSIAFPSFTGNGWVSVFVLQDSDGRVWSGPSYDSAMAGGTYAIKNITGKNYFTGTVYFNVFTDLVYPTEFTLISALSVERPDLSEVTYVAFGDSITCGIDGNYGSGEAGRVMASPYPKLVGEMLEIGTVDNQGVSGASFCPKQGRTNMTQKILSFTEKADIISLMLGVNDFWDGLPLGDPSCKDNTTIYGSLYLISEHLTTTYPDAFIFYMTPFQCTKSVNSSGYTLKDVADAIKTIAAEYDIPVLDMYTYGKYEIEMNVSPNDGIHPSQQHHINYLSVRDKYW